MINEKQLIEILQKNSIFEKITNAEGKNIYEIIDDLPKVGEWIPCSERMPNTNGVYQVTREIIDVIYPVRIQTCAYFDGQNTWHNDNRVNHGREYLNDIVAWMPLSEPYNADM